MFRFWPAPLSLDVIVHLSVFLFVVSGETDTTAHSTGRRGCFSVLGLCPGSDEIYTVFVLGVPDSCSACHSKTVTAVVHRHCGYLAERNGTQKRPQCNGTRLWAVGHLPQSRHTSVLAETTVVHKHSVTLLQCTGTQKRP